MIYRRRLLTSVLTSRYVNFINSKNLHLRKIHDCLYALLNGMNINRQRTFGHVVVFPVVFETGDGGACAVAELTQVCVRSARTTPPHLPLLRRLTIQKYATQLE